MIIDRKNEGLEKEVLSFAAEHAREIVEFEKRREDSIIVQASNMQTVFAVISAAIVIVAQTVIENRPSRACPD